jgi:tRNA pseudouridine38-40 synthase
VTSASSTVPNVLNFAARVAYDGTRYHGFQFQAGVPTIQGVLEDALEQVAEAEGRVEGAGRTDTGVHANGQVIGVRVAWRHDAAALQAAWNAHLPADICLRQMVEAPPDFRPRFSALARIYRYWVVAFGRAERSSPRRSPLTDRYALFERGPLDMRAMNQAARYLVGEHDFATFGTPTQGDSTVRRVTKAEWLEWPPVEPLDIYPGRRYVFTISANGFLQKMVRAITSTLLEVGRGQWEPECMLAALRARNRQAAARPAPPHGLVLEQVIYPGEWEQLFEPDIKNEL